MLNLSVKFLRIRFSVYASICLCLCFCSQRSGQAQEFDEQFDHWPVDLKINGTVLVGGQLVDLPVACDLLEQLSGSDEEHDHSCLLIHQYDATTEPLRNLEAAYAKCFSNVSSVHVTQLARLPSKEIPAVIGWQVDIQKPMVGDLSVAYEFLAAQLSAGKSIIACGTASSLGQYVVQDESEPVQPGGNLLPNCIVQTDYQSSAQEALLNAVDAQTRCVGVGLEAGTVLALTGRKIVVAGEGKATFLLPANQRQAARVESIVPLRDSKQSPTEWLVDLTEWRRDAIDRTLDAFPRPQPQVPHVANGKLVIVGGGRLPEGLTEQFIELAGGIDRARLVFIPCAEEERVSPRQSMIERWKSMGVANTTMVHTKDRQRANEDEKILAPLRNATGIWFGGGRQWNFSDSYYGTTAHQLMKRVLQQGGVIGGSSAGASIQARYLARATPIQNLRIMAPGYERGGLGFISGVAIDQHFSQRARQSDMARLVDRYPQLLGIGIDEQTAIIVKKSMAEVVGVGQVYFYDRQPDVPPNDEANFQSLEAGQFYDLATRRHLSQSNHDVLSVSPTSTENASDSD